MKALREAKAFVSVIGTPLCRAEELLAALVEAVEAAPVVLVGESINYGALLAGTGIKNGQRVRVLAVGEDSND